MKKFKKFLLILAYVTPCILSVILMINIWVLSSADDYIFVDTERMEEPEAIIVLGASVKGETELSLTLKDRLDTGIKLYKDKVAPKILMTGDHGSEYYNEVQAMKDYAVEQGIPEIDIFMDHAGFDTYDSMYRARDVFEVERAVIVSQEFHVPRAVYIARDLGINAYGYESEIIFPWYYRVRIREWLARVKAWWEVEIWNPKPTYLGEKIPISGDGRATQD